MSRFSGLGPSLPKCPLNHISPPNGIIPIWWIWTLHTEGGLYVVVSCDEMLSMSKFFLFQAVKCTLIDNAKGKVFLFIFCRCNDKACIGCRLWWHNVRILNRYLAFWCIFGLTKTQITKKAWINTQLSQFLFIINHSDIDDRWNVLARSSLIKMI